MKPNGLISTATLLVILLGQPAFTQNAGTIAPDFAADTGGSTDMNSLIAQAGALVPTQTTAYRYFGPHDDSSRSDMESAKSRGSQ